MEPETAGPPIAVVSDERSLALARALRVASSTLEWWVLGVLALSVLAFGAVHAWTRLPLAAACLGLAGLLALRAGLAGALRGRLGETAVSLHPSGRWLGVGEAAREGRGACLDLAAPAVSGGPLLVPGAVFAAWVVFQLLPLPGWLFAFLVRSDPLGLPGDWTRLTASLGDTSRGLAYLLGALVVHAAAATAFRERAARRRLLRRLQALGTLLALLALVQASAGGAIYGFFEPVEKPPEGTFGPFVNRNHFAAYMLMLAPCCLGLFAAAWRRYAARVGERAPLRRWLVVLSGDAGTASLYALVPALATVGALIATQSRGGLLAFAGAQGLAAVALRSRRRLPLWALAGVFLATTLSWYGLERLEIRFGSAERDAPGRTEVWADALRRIEGRWLTGTGFNAFGDSVSRTTAWSLPAGATGWTPAEMTILWPLAGYRSPERTHGIGWYREAHNDYVQLLAEMGLPGLLLALWAALRVLRSTGSDPWLLAALSGVLMHEAVEFGLQIPAVALLFVTLAALPPRPAPEIR